MYNASISTRNLRVKRCDASMSALCLCLHHPGLHVRRKHKHKHKHKHKEKKTEKQWQVVSVHSSYSCCYLQYGGSNFLCFYTCLQYVTLSLGLCLCLHRTCKPGFRGCKIIIINGSKILSLVFLSMSPRLPWPCKRKWRLQEWKTHEIWLQYFSSSHIFFLEDLYLVLNATQFNFLFCFACVWQNLFLL